MKYASRKMKNIHFSLRGHHLKERVITAIYYLFRIFPLQQKVIATTFHGRKYGDNPQYVIEKLHENNKEISIVWLKDRHSQYEVPQWVRTAYYGNSLKTIYEIATARVFIDSHRPFVYFRKRKGQLFIDTWHGGLGIKKVAADNITSEYMDHSLWVTNRMVDVFISQSEHLSKIYRSAFKWEGPIFKCGYPKNDILFSDCTVARQEVFSALNIRTDKMLLYAPTYRDSFDREDRVDFRPFDIDYQVLQDTLHERFGGVWTICVRWHPMYVKELRALKLTDKNVMDVTSYGDMQKLILSADVAISDYSSCLFDAALRGIPCFTYANDFEQYKRLRPVYYEMEELPFPYARNNDELVSNILAFDDSDYQKRWKLFAERMGLNETGHASEIISEKILSFLDGKTVQWDN